MRQRETPPELLPPREPRLEPHLLFNAQELIVLRQPLAACHRADLDLPGPGGHGQVGEVLSSVSPLRAEITVR